MTKAELIKQIVKKTGVEKKDVSMIVESCISTVKQSMINGENVYLRGFGSFTVKKRAEKKARNISMNTTITIPEHNVPAFKPAKSFSQTVKKNVTTDKNKSRWKR